METSTINNGPSTAQKQTLQRMKPYKAVLVVRIQHQENNCGNEGEVGKRSCNVFSQRTNLAAGRLLDLHGAPASWTESRRLRHLSSAMRASNQGSARRGFVWNIGRIHCRDHIKTRRVRQMAESI